jgi:hypothetical protein
MNVAQMIDWLKTMPYSAEVEVIHHTSKGCGYYEQGGTATTKTFEADERFRNSNQTYVDGRCFELYTDSHGRQTLTIGTLND